MQRKLSSEKTLNALTITQNELAYLRYHELRGASSSTIRHYKGTFDIYALFREETKSDYLTEQSIADFTFWLRETPVRQTHRTGKRAPATVFGHIKDLKAYVRWLFAEEKIDAVPRITMPKLTTNFYPILNQGQLQTIFNCEQLSPNSEIGIRNRAIISFLLDTGARKSEVVNLELSDLFLEERAAKVRGKGNKERLVFFSDGCKKTLLAWLAVRGSEDGTLFWLSGWGLASLMRRIKKETGIEKLHAHQFRHTCITMLLRRNTDLHTVRRIAGHSDIKTTESYIHLVSDDLRKKHDEASPYDQISSLRKSPSKHPTLKRKTR